jgi:serine/threonine protein kinase
MPADEFVLVEEYMEHDLAGLMHSKHRFSEPHIKCIMHQLLSGLHECHQMQLIHRDIKSMSVVVFSFVCPLCACKLNAFVALVNQSNDRLQHFDAQRQPADHGLWVHDDGGECYALPVLRDHHPLVPPTGVASGHHYLRQGG